MSVKHKHNLILIADDDADDQELLEEAVLEIAPESSVVKVWNGQEALEYLHSCADDCLPDLMVLDYSMPLVNGVELLARLCKDARLVAIPKFVWSTSNSPVYVTECLNSGALRYFVKPDSTGKLRTMAEEILAVASEAKSGEPANKQ